MGITSVLDNVKQFYVYILTNKRFGTLYVGMTNNLVRRVNEHKNKINDGFSKRYDISKLVYFETLSTFNEAMLREKQLKKWRREDKYKLIKSINPQWHDLFATLVNW